MNSKKKGFTLMELVIVLAIIGILSAIIIPSWGYFMRRSRERTANARAKVVFNAAQTEITRIAQRERTAMNRVHESLAAGNAAEARSLFDAEYMGDYCNLDGSGAPDYEDFYFYWDGTRGGLANSDGSFISDAAPSADDVRLSNAINNITGGEGVYKIYVQNYNVQSVVYSNNLNGRYKGTYPKQMGANALTEAEESDIRNDSVENAKMKSIAIP